MVFARARDDSIQWITTHRITFALCFILLVLAFTQRYETITTAANDEFPGSDAHSYMLDAQAAATGKGTIGYYFNPGQTLFLYTFYKIGLDDSAIRTIQIILSLIASIFLYKLARTIFDEHVALVSFIVSLFDPFWSFYSVHYWGEQLLLPCIVFFSYLYFRMLLHNESRISRIILMGFFIALGSLVKSWFLGLILAAAVGILFYHHFKNLKTHLTTCALLLLFSFLFILPWGLHNYHRSGAFIITATNPATNLFIGNNPYAQIAFTSDYPPEMSHVLDDVLINGERCADLIANSTGDRLVLANYACHKKYAINYVLSNPGWFIKKITAFSFTYWFFPNQYWYQRPIPNFNQVIKYLWIKWTLALIGFTLSLRTFRKHLFTYCFFAGVWFSYAISFYLARYKDALLPFQIIYAAFGLVIIGQFIWYAIKSTREKKHE